MAKKLTKKIRISEYDVLQNEYQLTFQLSGYADSLVFDATYESELLVTFTTDTEYTLTGIGFSKIDTDQMAVEIHDWINKSRRALNGQSHGHMMRSRFETEARLEAERRSAAEARRVVAEAPCLDYAMSVTENLVDEPVVGADETAPVKWHLVDCSPVIAPKKPSSERGCLDEAAQQPLIDIQTIYNHPKVQATQDQIANGASFLSADKRSQDAAKFVRAYFTRDFSNISDQDIRIGRDTVREVADATRDMLINPVQEVKEFVAACECGSMTREQVADRLGVDLKEADWERAAEEKVVAMEAVGFGEEQSLAKVNQSLVDGIKSRAEVFAEFGFTPPKLPTAAIDNAVDEIHTHMRRFLDKAMSMREHNFIRSVIEEEITKVVERVL